ncbi:MAG: hypothetical protein ACREQY_09760, partial [Candidatus Binatia bacterium]
MGYGDVQDAGVGRAAEGAPPSGEESPWPFAPGRRTVFLLDASSSLETRLLEEWIEKNRPEGIDPAAIEALAIPPSRRPSRAKRAEPALEASLATADDPLLAPLRIAWMPEEESK